MTIYCEASDQPQAGRIAVAATFFNRLRSGRYGSTIAEVCLRRFAYSEWNDDKNDNANLLRAARANDLDPILAACQLAYNTAASGTDPTSGATHYYRSGTPIPSWAQGKTPCAVIGEHLFFNDID